jgi:hypothetical protein
MGMKLMLALVAALSIGGCRDSAPRPAATVTPDRPDQMIGGTVVPQSHEFPVGRAAEIRRIFEGSALSYPIAVMSKEGVQTQFVNPKPVFVGDHRFVVGLPPASHAALDRLIAALDKAAPPLGATYELTFWVVDAGAAAETEVTRDLAEVAPMLERLAALGKRRYKSLDRVAGRSRDGADTKLAGRMIHISHKLMAGPDGIELDLELQLKGAWADKTDNGPVVETTLHLPLDQPIVIGDSAQSTAADGAANLLLYVVRARRVD